MKDETGTTPTFPPRSGKGSGTKEWAAFAADHGITIEDGADRDTIIAAVDAVFGDPLASDRDASATDPEPSNDTVALADGPGRTFHMTPAGIMFTYELPDSTTVRVWQFPPPKPKVLATLDESSAASVTSWRLRVLDANGDLLRPAGNLDRTYSTAQVNDAIAVLAGPS